MLALAQALMSAPRILSDRRAVGGSGSATAGSAATIDKIKEPKEGYRFDDCMTARQNPTRPSSIADRGYVDRAWTDRRRGSSAETLVQQRRRSAEFSSRRSDIIPEQNCWQSRRP